MRVVYLVAACLHAREEATVLANDLVHRVACELREARRGADDRKEVGCCIDDVKRTAFRNSAHAKALKHGHDLVGEILLEGDHQALLVTREK